MLSLYSINHHKANATHPQKTTPWFCNRVFSSKLTGDVSVGTLAAGGLGLAAVFDIFTTFKNQLEEGTSFSLWKNIIRPLLWGTGIIGVYNYTKIPKNAEDIDLVNNSVKDVIENIRVKIGDDKSFTKILSKDSISNLSSASNTLLENALNVIKQYFPKDSSDYEACICRLREQGNPLYELVKVFDPDLSKEKQLEGLKDLLKNNPGLLHGVVFQNKEVERKVMTSIFAVPSKEQFENENIGKIRKEINNLLESIGLGLLPIHYDNVNDQIKLYFVTTKGYHLGNNSSDGKLYLGGTEVVLDPGDFFIVSRDIVDKLNRLSEDEVAKQLAENKPVSKEQIEALNKQILAILGPWIPRLNGSGCVNAIKAELDPKTGKYKYFSLGPLIKILNDASSTEERKLRDIVGPSAGVFFVPNPTTKSEDKKDGKDDGLVGVGGGDHDIVTTSEGEIDFAKLNALYAREKRAEAAAEAKKLESQSKKVPQIHEEIAISKKVKKDRQDFFEGECEKLGITVKQNEITSLTDLKLALLMSQVRREYGKEGAMIRAKEGILSKEIVRKSAEDTAEEILNRLKGEIKASVRKSQSAISDKALEEEVKKRLAQGGVNRGDLITKELEKTEVVFASNEEASKMIDYYIDFMIKKGVITQDQAQSERTKLNNWFNEGTLIFKYVDGTKKLYRSKSLLEQVKIPEDKAKLAKEEQERNISKLHGSIISDYFPGAYKVHQVGGHQVKDKNAEHPYMDGNEGDFVGKKSREYCLQNLSTETCKTTINSDLFGLKQFLTIILEKALEKNNGRFRNVEIVGDQISFEVKIDGDKYEEREPSNGKELFLELMNSTGGGIGDVLVRLEKLFGVMDPTKAKVLREEALEIKVKIDADNEEEHRAYEERRKEARAVEESKEYLESQCKKIGIRIDKNNPVSFTKLKFALLMSQVKKDRTGALIREKEAIHSPVLQREIAEKRIAQSLKAEQAKIVQQIISGKVDPEFKQILLENPNNTDKCVDQILSKIKERLLSEECAKIKIAYVSDSEIKQIIDSLVDKMLKEEDPEGKKEKLFASFSEGNLQVSDKGIIVYKSRALLEPVEIAKDDQEYNANISKVQRVIGDYLPSKEALSQMISQVKLEHLLAVALEARLDSKKGKVKKADLFNELLNMSEDNTGKVLEYLEPIISALPQSKADELRMEALEIKRGIDKARRETISALRAAEEKLRQADKTPPSSPQSSTAAGKKEAELAGKK